MINANGMKIELEMVHTPYGAFLLPGILAAGFECTGISLEQNTAEGWLNLATRKRGEWLRVMDTGYRIQSNGMVTKNAKCYKIAPCFCDCHA